MDEFENFGTISKNCPHCHSSDTHITTKPWIEKHGSVVLVMTKIGRHCQCCDWEGVEVTACAGPFMRGKYTRKKYLN